MPRLAGRFLLCGLLRNILDGNTATQIGSVMGIDFACRQLQISDKAVINCDPPVFFFTRALGFVYLDAVNQVIIVDGGDAGGGIGDRCQIAAVIVGITDSVPVLKGLLDQPPYVIIGIVYTISIAVVKGRQEIPVGKARG